MMQTLTDRLIHAVTALTFVLMFSFAAFAQQETPEPQTDNEEVAEPTQPDQEVEVNEDNYRQFMELKDGLQQRTIAPEDSFESRSGLQKLDNLPEASQKHLRNQLREIISQGDRWQPGDENADYPYVPSDAARTNAGLQKQEAEAWGELVDNYHAREAQIYANSARSSAALAGSGAAMSGAGEGESGEQNRSGQSQQSSEKPASRSGGKTGSFAPGAQGSAEARNNEGVAQNAMEFLQNAGYQDGSGQQQAQQGQQEQQGESGQTGAQAQQPAQASQGETASTNMQSTAASQGAQNTSQTQDPDGTEQNAMQYLQQLGQQQDGAGESGAQQAGDGSETSSESNQEAMGATDSQTLSIEIGSTASDADDPEGVSQNALEYLAGEGASEGDAPADTLSIEDLLNAQGVGTGASAPQPEEPPKNPPDKPDKGGGG